jgi:hypothetical protein
MAAVEDGLILHLKTAKGEKIKVALPKQLEEVDDESDALDPQDGPGKKKTIEEVKASDLLFDFTATTFMKKEDLFGL